jgi:magnesium-protoporphyrin O-methyltransferase
MDCCVSAGTDRFFSKYSGKYARRFRKRGPDKPSRMLIDQLDRIGVTSKTVLDIGCGVGDVHLSLLDRRASFAVAVDLSQGMLEQAEKLAKERGVVERVRYVHGDLVAVGDAIGKADIVVLDKVVCCYEDPGELLSHSSGKAERFLALSYPRSSRFASCGFRVLDWLGEFLGWAFHPYYHEPALLEKMMTGFGFGEVFSGTTMIWQIKIYERR